MTTKTPAAEVSWQVDLHARAGSFRLAAAFSARARVVALFGPSGAGKSTLVECLAGVRPASGTVRIGSASWLGPDGAVPARRRQVGWVPQEGALFPHRSVRENLLYGAASGAEPDPRVLEVLGIGALLQRSPAGLSGGEQRRVALGRALCARPSLLLLDEPLSGVDLPRRARTFRYLLAARDAFSLPMLYVSHDPAEVLAIADHVVLLESGKVVGSGPPRQLLADAAALRFLDRLGFENVLRVELPPHAERDPLHALTVRTPGGRQLVAPPGPRDLGSAGWLAVRAEDVMLAAAEPRQISARNVLAGVVRAVEESGSHLLVRVDAGDEWFATLTRRAVDELQLAAGRPAWVVVKTHAFHWLAD